jgi:stage II sporulation protein AA (anti-sigma F factor antagonist)
MRVTRRKLWGRAATGSSADTNARVASSAATVADNGAQPAPPIPQPHDEHRFRVENRSLGTSHTLLVVGAFELGAIDVFDAAVNELLSSDANAQSVLVDLSGVTFIDSSGLWAITTLQKWCARGSISFSVLRGPDPVHRVFELTGLSDVIRFAD